MQKFLSILLVLTLPVALYSQEAAYKNAQSKADANIVAVAKTKTTVDAYIKIVVDNKSALDKKLEKIELSKTDQESVNKMNKEITLLISLFTKEVSAADSLLKSSSALAESGRLALTYSSGINYYTDSHKNSSSASTRLSNAFKAATATQTLNNNIETIIKSYEK